MHNLLNQKCIPCEGGVPRLTKKEAEQLLQQIPNWELDPETSRIQRDFTFKNFYQTIGFVNAVAYIANQQNHHPDLEVGYNHCKVIYHTHAIQGLSENDFICAAKINKAIE